MQPRGGLSGWLVLFSILLWWLHSPVLLRPAFLIAFVVLAAWYGFDWVMASQRARDGEHRHVLLVTAHPDDESMFFAPTLQTMVRGQTVHLLCLSTGNYEGLGRVRSRELLASGRVLGLPVERITVVDDPLLQDGPDKTWSPTRIHHHLSRHTASHATDEIVTFDGSGVSGHPNHIAVHAAVMSWLKAQGVGATTASPAGQSSFPCPPTAKPAIVGYSLHSLPLLAKYTGPAVALWTGVGYACHVLCSLGRATATKDAPKRRVYWDPSPGLCYRATAAHASQFVWYRRLFCLFSSYAYVNSLHRIQ